MSPCTFLPAATLLVAILFIISACSRSAGDVTADIPDITQTPAARQVVIGEVITNPDRHPKLGTWRATDISLSRSGALSGTLVFTDTAPSLVAGEHPDALFLWFTAQYLDPSHGDFIGERTNPTPVEARHVDRNGAVFDLDVQLQIPPPSIGSEMERMPLHSLHLELLWARSVRVTAASYPPRRRNLGLGRIVAGFATSADEAPTLILDAPAVTLSGALYGQQGPAPEEVLDYLATHLPVIRPSPLPPDYPPPPTLFPTRAPYPYGYPDR